MKQLMYHGTEKNFNEFIHPTFNFFFTDSKRGARTYGRIIIEAYLSMQNPKVIDYDGAEDNCIHEDIEDAKQEGYDGVIALNTNDGTNDINQYIVFSNTQIRQINTTFN